MKKKVLLSSILTIALCLSLIAGSTFALFTSESKVNVAVTSGTVDVVAVLKEGSLKAFSGQWNAETNSYDSVEVSADNATSKTFTNGGTVVANDDSNVLTISKITPMDKVSFVIAVTNNSDVAIQYQTVVSSLATAFAEDGFTTLMDGLKVTVDGIETVKVGNNAVTEWSSDFAQGETKEISVVIELPEGAGNEYQGLAAEISYTVNAVQGNAYVENPVADDETVMYIYTVADLKELASYVNTGKFAEENVIKTVKMMADIDLANEAWTPIGNSTYKFTATFDGGNFTVSNLLLDMEGKSNVGLFGFTTNGLIKNLKINNASVKGRLNVGVVAGTPYTSKYENITVTGKVTVDGMSYVGGVAGKNAYADMTDITVNVTADSYVKAYSIENGTAYRTYVGGVVGFCGEGGHSFTNIVSNIDVIGSTCDIGGIVGIAHYGNSFINCVSTGDVTVTDASEAGDAEEMGGIAGVWHNGGSDVTFEDCAYTGTLTANITEGVDLTDNTIVGNAYSANGVGKLVIKANGAQLTADAADITVALEAGNNVTLTGDVETTASATMPYGSKVGFIQKGGVLDGNGNTLTVEQSGGGEYYALMTYGGTIKNLTIDEGFRGIVTYAPTEDVILENVHVGGDFVGYAINTAEHTTLEGIKFIVKDSSFAGWSSFDGGFESASFDNCEFKVGGYYGSWPYDSLIKPYITTTFTNCAFAEDYYLDLSALAEGCKVTLTNCTVNGTVVTADNYAELFGELELPSGRTLADCVVFG